MIRVCDGTDQGLRREQVDRVSASGQESVGWRPCDCGLRFNDSERLTVYPHQYIHGNLNEEERAQLARRVDELVAGGKSAEEIREWLTSQPVSDNVDQSKRSTEERSHMDEQNPGYEPVTGESTENVAAEGTSNTEAEQAEAERAESFETADEAAARRERENTQDGF